MRRCRPTVPATAIMAGSTVSLIILAARLLPGAAAWVGGDYSYFLPYLVSGAGWIRTHGWLAPPYFTPDFCGGIPWLANPQSVFYSLPQWLAMLMAPVAVARWTLLLSATVGAAATYWLLRRCRGASIEAAALGFALFQLNGLLIFRLAAGHLTFQVFGLAPLLALLILFPRTSRRREFGLIAGAALCIAAMTFGGGALLVAPIVIGLAATIAIMQFGGQLDAAPFLRLAAATLWSILIAAIKLVPALILTTEFHRQSPVLLVSPLANYVVQLPRSLFLPETLPPFVAASTSRIALNQHEFEFGVSVVPLLLIGALFVRWLRRPIRRPSLGPALLLLAIIVLVSALSTGSTAWAAMLSHVPIVRDYSVGTRWWIAFVVPLIVAGPLALDVITPRPRARGVLVLACGAILVAQNLVRPIARYASDTTFSMYDPAPATAALARVHDGTPPPPIGVIARPVVERRADGATPWAANDGVFAGRSAVPCYEPLFDHDFSLFPARSLTPGPITASAVAGAINLADPRCYFGGECKPGALFREADSATARQFAAHGGLQWREPLWQRLSAWATIAGLLLAVIAVLRSAVRTAAPTDPAEREPVE
jgi:hypothetical protein